MIKTIIEIALTIGVVIIAASALIIIGLFGYSAIIGCIEGIKKSGDE